MTKKALFLTYASADRDLAGEFRCHVRQLERQGEIEILDPGRVPVGEAGGAWLTSALGRSDLHVVFHSADLYSDDRVYEHLLVALERGADGLARVFPIRVRGVGATDPALEGLQHLPRTGPAIGEMADRGQRDQIWAAIVAELRGLLHQEPVRGSRAAIPSSHLSSAPPSAGARTWLLVFAANPSTTTRLRLDREIDAITDGLNAATAAPRTMKSVWATRYDQLQPKILEHAPLLLQFSGHGEQDGRLLLEEADRAVHPLFPEAVVGLFSSLGEGRRPTVVVFNLCHSADLARGVSEVTGYAIGVGGTWSDASASVFARAFYSGLAALSLGDAAGQPPAESAIRTAFALALNQLRLGNCADAIHPGLFIRGQAIADPEAAPPGARKSPLPKLGVSPVLTGLLGVALLVVLVAFASSLAGRLVLGPSSADLEQVGGASDSGIRRLPAADASLSSADSESRCDGTGVDGGSSPGPSPTEKSLRARRTGGNSPGPRRGTRRSPASPTVPSPAEHKKQPSPDPSQKDPF